MTWLISAVIYCGIVWLLWALFYVGRRGPHD